MQTPSHDVDNRVSAIAVHVAIETCSICDCEVVDRTIS